MGRLIKYHSTDGKSLSRRIYFSLILHSQIVILILNGNKAKRSRQGIQFCRKSKGSDMSRKTTLRVKANWGIWFFLNVHLDKDTRCMYSRVQNKRSPTFINLKKNQMIRKLKLRKRIKIMLVNFSKMGGDYVYSNPYVYSGL